jgi:hypothetical protein
MAHPRKRNKPKTWTRRSPTLKRSQPRQARKQGRETSFYISPRRLMQYLRVSGAICPNSLELQDIDSRTPCS